MCLLLDIDESPQIGTVVSAGQTRTEVGKQNGKLRVTGDSKLKATCLYDLAEIVEI